MSKNFEKIKKWYMMGIYDDKVVHQMVEQGQITAEEYKFITGKDYK